MLRRAEQGRAVRLLDNLPALHHAHAVGNAPHQVQVMADQQQRHAQACLQFLEQVENFQLHGHIQRRGRFVGNQQFRLVGQGHGDHHPLALPAGQLVGQGLEAFARLRDADHFQQLQGARSGLLAGQALVQQKDFIDLLFDAVQRVQRRHRLLEDHRNAVAANALQGFFVLLQQVLAFMADAAAGVLGQGVGQQAQDRVRSHRLARAAFTDQRQRLAFADVETDAIHHPVDLVAGYKLDDQVAHFDQVLFTHVTSSGRRRRGRIRR